MKPPQAVPPEARVDVPREQISTVLFASAILEFVMSSTGTTILKAGCSSTGKYLIHVGSQTFTGDSQGEAFQKLFLYVLWCRPPFSEAEREAAAKAAEEKEKRESDELIEELTKDGMTSFGKQVEEARQAREKKLDEYLENLHPLDLHDFSVLQQDLQTKTGFLDLGADEVLAAVARRGQK